MKLKIFFVLLILQTIQVFVNANINCIVCNSKIRNCATANGLERYSQECYINETSCFTGIEARNGGTVRGCGTGSNLYLSMVLPCMENNCNADLYPKNRLTCNHCREGLSGCLEDLTNSTQFIEACEIYKEVDTCYSSYSDQYGGHRGCTSDSFSYPLPCYENSHSCTLCSGNNCNTNIIKKIIIPISNCIVCNSLNPFEKNCATGKNLDKFSMDCFTNVSISECFTQIDSNGHTERGCGFGSNRPNKEICREENCNNKLFPKNRLTCHHCNTEDDGSRCRYNLQNATYYVEACSRYFINDKCYSLYAENKSRRGCYSDNTYPDNCLQDPSCHQCNYDNCNGEGK